MGVFKKKVSNGQVVYGMDFYANGRRYRKLVGSSKSLAEKALAKVEVEIAENKFLDIKKEQRIKFEDFANEFYENHCKVNHRTPHKAAGSSLKVLRRFFSGVYLHEINPQMIEKFKRERCMEVSPSTVNRALVTLKSLFNRAADWGKFDGENPVRKVKLFPENNTRTQFLEKEEIGSLINACDDRLRPIVIVAINTGMRKSEILNLKWHDIDFERGIIYLLRTKNNERRDIPMNEAVKSAIVSVKKHPSSPYIFCTKKGNPFTDIRKSYGKAIERAGIKYIVFHSLRHTFASQLVMAGVDLNSVRELLGHKSLRMTLRYSHLSLDHKKRAVEILSRQMDTFWSLEKKETTDSNNFKDTSLSDANAYENKVIF